MNPKPKTQNKQNSMKKKTTIFLAAALSIAAAGSSLAQTNLGQDCGCPVPVSSRPTVLLSSLAVNGGASDGDLLNKNTILTCNKTWILDKKIFVPNGSTLQIEPGTVIKGRLRSTADSATALIVSRGGKIIADGTPTCQIVMTVENDPMDGSLPIHTATANKWGGLVIAGQASNNLTLAKNGPFQAGVGDGKICVADGLGTFEGFATSDFRDQFGVNLTTPQAGYNTTFDDNDNSGVLEYVSVRFAGAILQVGGELNGISFGSVGRGTRVENVEVICAADDNMEFWGGTVNIKHFTGMFGNDDNFDFDDGYSGHGQFIFTVKGPSNDTAVANTNYSYAADNGFEADADDQQSGNGSGVAIGTIQAGGYRSHPVFYNSTMISDNKRHLNSDNTGVAAIMAKELTEGEWYNNIFANFAVGLDLWTGGKPGEGARVNTTSSTGQTVLDSYDNWRDNNGTPSLIVKNNTFVGTGSGYPSSANAALVLDVTKKSIDGSGNQPSYYNNPTQYKASTRDSTQFYVTDGNVAVTSVPGFTYLWNMNTTTNAVSTQYDATPNPNLASTITAPADGFFTPVNYRGAFDANKPSWLSGWAYATLLQTTGGLAPCPTDINQDGITDNQDFLLLLGQFGQMCH